MEILYFLVGFVAIFIIGIFAFYQYISSKLAGSSQKPIDEEQRQKCMEAISSGKAPSVYCRIYVKKGKCPENNCKHQ